MIRGIGAIGACCLASILPLPVLHADCDFNNGVAFIEDAYHLHREHIPLIGLGSICARVATGGSRTLRVS